MPEHLRLSAPLQSDSRRSSPPDRSPRDQKDPRTHGARLATGLAAATQGRKIARSVDPNLVFKIQATGRPVDGSLAQRGLQLLGETRDFTYFVLVEDEGEALQKALTLYTRTGDLRSLMNMFQGIELYGSEDRRGPGLADPDENGPFLVDVKIWPSETRDEAVRRFEVVQDVLTQSSSRILLKDVTVARTVIRAEVTKLALDTLLEVSVIERVRTPPVPFLDFSDWYNASADDLTRELRPSAAVGVLDDSPALAHPLLENLVTVSEIAEEGFVWSDPTHHGSEVVGRVLFPFLEEQLRDGLPITAHGLVHVARILHADPALNNSKHPVFAGSYTEASLVERAIRKLHADHAVRIYNLSFGYAEPFNSVHVEELTETIDRLARELDIVIVVPTGNLSVSADGTLSSGHHIRDHYPHFLDHEDHRLSEPGPASLAVTVGAIAHSDAVAELRAERFSWEAIAGIGSISPFSRSGPGLGSAALRRNKPDFVHTGGNSVINDMGLVVPDEPGSSVISTALDPSGRLFRACNGTSFAAPSVARAAADILHAYPDASANLIRALLASGSKLPAAAQDTQSDLLRTVRYGMGVPNVDESIESTFSRVTLLYDGGMPTEAVRLHAVPVPPEFRSGKRERTISVTLAFDPPVRSKRREYLAGTMSFGLYRNLEPSELLETLQAQPDTDLDLIRDGGRHLKLEPPMQSFASSTLMKRSWRRKASFIDDTDTFYVAVTHKAASWARNADYNVQDYALTVTLSDRDIGSVNLYTLVANRIQQSERVRI